MAGNQNSGHRLDKERMLVASLAREHTEKAIKKLAQILETGQSETAQIQAATALLDRGWGKPLQATENKHEGEMVVHWPVPKSSLDE